MTITSMQFSASTCHGEPRRAPISGPLLDMGSGSTDFTAFAALQAPHAASVGQQAVLVRMGRPECRYILSAWILKDISPPPVARHLTLDLLPPYLVRVV